jgi:hypothetical protein
VNSQEAHKYLQVSRSALYRLVRTRQIYASRLDERSFTFDKENLDWFLGRKEMARRAENSTEPQKRRAALFDQGAKLYQATGDTSGLIYCRRHPHRIVNRSGYVFDCHRRCGSCKSNKRADGSPRPAHARNVRKRDYAKSMELRKFYFGRSRMTAMRVFERCTGLNLEDFGFSRKEINAKHN